jgi:hypothetical protein
MRKELYHMQQANKSKGFFTFAQNTKDVDYVRLAYGLALSLKHSQSKISNLSIGITPSTVVDPKYAWAFDKIIEIPWGDDAENYDWKLQNEWKSIFITPYDETIKLDCDMLFFSDILSWWKHLELQTNDLVFTNSILNWSGQKVIDDYYRKVFTKNNLPNIYSGMFYFRKSPNVYQFFSLAKIIFWNWEKFFEEFFEPIYRPMYPSTDVVFALTMKILDLDMNSYTPIDYPTFVHMKTMIQGWTNENLSEDWQKHMKTFFTDDAVCKIGNHRQLFPLHYHVKNFLSDDIIKTYEKLIKHV